MPVQFGVETSTRGSGLYIELFKMASSASMSAMIAGAVAGGVVQAMSTSTRST